MARQHRLFDVDGLEKRTDIFDVVNDKVIVVTDKAGRFDKQYMLSVLELIGTGIGNDIYQKASPTTVTVGGLPSGSNIFGLTVSEILERILVPSLPPTFSSFSIQGQSQLIEVGVTFDGAKNFIWSTSNSQNVRLNTVSLVDTSANVILSMNLANDGNEVLNIVGIDTELPFTQSYVARAINDLNGLQIQSNTFSVQGIYPYFFGTSATLPVIDQALINSGTKVLSSSNGTLNITFNADIEYLWFAVPNSAPLKTQWFVDTLNQGSIGGGSDLFALPVNLVTNSPSSLWSNVTYEIYVSNFATTTTTNSTPVMQIRN